MSNDIKHQVIIFPDNMDVSFHEQVSYVSILPRLSEPFSTEALSLLGQLKKGTVILLVPMSYWIKAEDSGFQLKELLKDASFNFFALFYDSDKDYQTLCLKEHIPPALKDIYVKTKKLFTTKYPDDVRFVKLDEGVPFSYFNDELFVKVSSDEKNRLAVSIPEMYDVGEMYMNTRGDLMVTGVQNIKFENVQHNGFFDLKLYEATVTPVDNKPIYGLEFKCALYGKEFNLCFHSEAKREHFSQLFATKALNVELTLFREFKAVLENATQENQLTQPSFIENKTLKFPAVHTTIAPWTAQKNDFTDMWNLLLTRLQKIEYAYGAVIGDLTVSKWKELYNQEIKNHPLSQNLEEVSFLKLVEYVLEKNKTLG